MTFQVAAAIVHVLGQLDELIADAENELDVAIDVMDDTTGTGAVKLIYARLKSLREAHRKLTEAT
jgi:hypothetical protein